MNFPFCATYEGSDVNPIVRPRMQSLLLGAITGMGGATLALVLVSWGGIATGAVLGIGLSAVLGGLGTYTALTIFETMICERLAAAERAGTTLPNAISDDPGGTVGTALALVSESLQRARRLEEDNEAIARTARTFWEAVHGKAVGHSAPPETRECVADFFDLFRQTAEVLVHYASTLEEANERMASGAVDQTETVARTTSTVEDLSDKIDRISRNAEDATEACGRTRHEARNGLDQVHRVIEGMEKLRVQIEINGRKARRLGDRSVEIGTIVELIRGISSRTDMLALNATIESVRAGEHGRGFAVVAEEIRKLAERTASATRDIGTLVEAIQADTHESIRALGEEQSEMEQEAQRVREAGAALERISQVAEHSAELVDGISRSTNDQVLAAQELVRAMQRISDVSHLTLERSTASRQSIQGLSQWCERLAPLAAPARLPSESPAVESFALKGSTRRKRRLAGTELPV